MPGAVFWMIFLSLFALFTLCVHLQNIIIFFMRGEMLAWFLWFYLNSLSSKNCVICTMIFFFWKTQKIFLAKGLKIYLMFKNFYKFLNFFRFLIKILKYFTKKFLRSTSFFPSSLVEISSHHFVETQTKSK